MYCHHIRPGVKIRGEHIFVSEELHTTENHSMMVFRPYLTVLHPLQGPLNRQWFANGKNKCNHLDLLQGSH
jgi:hypothetical protein